MDRETRDGLNGPGGTLYTSTEIEVAIAALRALPSYDVIEGWSAEFHEPAFDPKYQSMPLGDFEPLVRKHCDATAYWQHSIDKGGV